MCRWARRRQHVQLPRTAHERRALERVAQQEALHGGPTVTVHVTREFALACRFVGEQEQVAPFAARLGSADTRMHGKSAAREHGVGGQFERVLAHCAAEGAELVVEGGGVPAGRWWDGALFGGDLIRTREW